MSVKTSSARSRPSSQKASAKATKRGSRVRFQKPRKNRPATRNPIVTAPERKSINTESILPIPDEAEQQHTDGQQKQQLSKQPEIPLWKDEQIDDHDQI